MCIDGKNETFLTYTQKGFLNSVLLRCYANPVTRQSKMEMAALVAQWEVGGKGKIC